MSRDKTKYSHGPVDFDRFKNLDRLCHHSIQNSLVECTFTMYRSCWKNLVPSLAMIWTDRLDSSQVFQKLGVNLQPSFQLLAVLEEDGTEVEEDDYFQVPTFSLDPSYGGVESTS